MRKKGVIIVAQVLLIFLLVFIIHASVPIGYDNVVKEDVQCVRWYDGDTQSCESCNPEAIAKLFENVVFKEVDEISDNKKLMCELIHRNTQSSIYLVEQNKIAIQRGDTWFETYRDDYLVLALEQLKSDNENTK